jgi:hypothetical protein
MDSDWESFGKLESSLTSNKPKREEYHAETNFRNSLEGMTNLSDGRYHLCSECFEEGIIEAFKSRKDMVYHMMASHALLEDNDLMVTRITPRGVDESSGWGWGWEMDKANEILKKKGIPIDTSNLSTDDCVEIVLRDLVEADL